jgi:hypothetical protein
MVWLHHPSGLISCYNLTHRASATLVPFCPWTHQTHSPSHPHIGCSLCLHCSSSNCCSNLTSSMKPILSYLKLYLASFPGLLITPIFPTSLGTFCYSIELTYLLCLLSVFPMIAKRDCYLLFIDTFQNQYHTWQTEDTE